MVKVEAKLPVGVYRAVFETTDRLGKTVKVIHSLQVLDPAERELPFSSWMVLRDIEDPTVEVRLDARQMAELYRENFAEHQAAIRRGCSAAEVDYLCLETSEPFANTLGRFLHLRSRQQ